MLRDILRLQQELRNEIENKQKRLQGQLEVDRERLVGPLRTKLVEIVDLIRQSGATLCGIGCVIEKVFEGGRDRLADLDVPILSLAKIDLDQDSFTVF